MHGLKASDAQYISQCCKAANSNQRQFTAIEMDVPVVVVTLTLLSRLTWKTPPLCGGKSIGFIRAVRDRKMEMNIQSENPINSTC